MTSTSILWLLIIFGAVWLFLDEIWGSRTISRIITEAGLLE